jgi:hypothetical protein
MPQKALTLSRKVDECKPLGEDAGGGEGEGGATNKIQSEVDAELAALDAELNEAMTVMRGVGVVPAPAGRASHQYKPIEVPYVHILMTVFQI